MPFKRGGKWWCRFSHNKKQERISLELSVDEHDLAAAQGEADRKYAEAVLEVRPAPVARSARTPSDPLEVHVDKYIAWLRSQGLSDGYIDLQDLHLNVHVLPRFERMYQLVAPGAIERYKGERANEPVRARTDKRPASVEKVSTETIRKELNTLGRFLRWAKGVAHLIDVVPEFDRPAPDSDYEVPNLTPEQVHAFLAALPRGDVHRKRMPVWEWATFTWSMALRFSESTASSRVRTRGAKKKGPVEWRDVDLNPRPRMPHGMLVVRPDVDKNGLRWDLPLAEEAQAVLTELAQAKPKPTDPVFQIKSVRGTFARVCADLGLPHITPHHLRHFRISELANNTRMLAAVQHFARHTNIATTGRYVRSQAEAAADVLAEVSARREQTKLAPPAPTSK